MWGLAPICRHINMRCEDDTGTPIDCDVYAYLPSSRLTDLLCLQVDELLPISAPAWPHLLELTLNDFGLTEFPQKLASA